MRRGRVVTAGGDPVGCRCELLLRRPVNPGPPGPVPPTAVSLPASSMYLPPPPGPPGMYRNRFSGRSDVAEVLARFCEDARTGLRCPLRRGVVADAIAGRFLCDRYYRGRVYGERSRGEWRRISKTTGYSSKRLCKGVISCGWWFCTCLEPAVRELRVFAGVTGRTSFSDVAK